MPCFTQTGALTKLIFFGLLLVINETKMLCFVICIFGTFFKNEKAHNMLKLRAHALPLRLNVVDFSSMY